MNAEVWLDSAFVAILIVVGKTLPRITRTAVRVWAARVVALVAFVGSVPAHISQRVKMVGGYPTFVHVFSHTYDRDVEL